MKIVITHTDFRVYWPPRLRALSAFLQTHDCHLIVIEIAGQGSPYAFAGSPDQRGIQWQTLFADQKMEDISPAHASAALCAALDSHQPDVVMAGSIAYPSGATAIRWCRRHSRPVVIFDNVRLQDVPRAPWVNWVKRRLYQNVNAVLIPAPSHVATFAYFGIAEERMFFGLNVVDNRQFEVVKSPDELHSRRHELQLPSRFFLAVGRHIAAKNFTTLLAAYRLYLTQTERTAAVPLVLVGDGPEHRALLDDAGDWAHCMILFRPFQPAETLVDYYALSLGLILPSRTETWGLVVNEAMAAGRPVLVSDACGCVETLVRDGQNGWCFSPTDTATLAAALGRLASLSELELAQFSEQSKAIISAWSLQRFCDGAWDAINYAVDHPIHGCSWIDRLLLNRWNGRYRPV